MMKSSLITLQNICNFESGKYICISFFPCSVKSVRVGPRALGMVGLPEPHIFFILALLEKHVHANNKPADLISTFAIRCLDRIVHTVAISKFSRFLQWNRQGGYLMIIIGKFSSVLHKNMFYSLDSNSTHNICFYGEISKIIP